MLHEHMKAGKTIPRKHGLQAASESRAPLSAEEKKTYEPRLDRVIRWNTMLIHVNINAPSVLQYFFGGRIDVDSPDYDWARNKILENHRSYKSKSFRCSQQPPFCTVCPSSTTGYFDLGRVSGVGRDYRAVAVEPKGQVVIQIQEVFHPQHVASILPIGPPAVQHERILSWNTVFYCTEAELGKRINVKLDYTFGNDKLATRSAAEYPPQTMIVRRILDTDADPPQLCLNHPICGELKIAAFGMDWLQQLDARASNRRTFSLPLLTFVDGFGLYRNTYRTLMGMYFIFAGLPFYECARRANVFPFTIGPHGSNFSDVVDGVRSLATLDRGVEVEMPGMGKVMLLAFPIAFIGDMPQQQKNSGMKTQRAYLGCRFCHINSEECGALDYDIFLEGRYHHTSCQCERIWTRLPLAQPVRHTAPSGELILIQRPWR